MIIGTNLSGGEFTPQTVPGTYNTTYTYPTTAELDYYNSKGMKIIRLPFLIERLQTALNGTLVSNDLGIISGLVSHANSNGQIVVLDAHDYGSMFGTVINTTAMYAAFAQFWGLMAGQFKSANVWFGLMNEPYQQTPAQWLPAINAAIAAIRAEGCTQTICVQGTAYTGAWTWISSGNSAAINPSTVVDPLNNYVFEVHQYLDSDGSGSHNTVVSSTIGSQRLQAVTQWAQGLSPMPKLFLGECGVATDATSLAALTNMVQYMEANSNVWEAFTYWSGGPWWGPYMYTIEPTGLGTATVTDQPQMTTLEPFITGGSMTTGTGTITVTDAAGGSATANFTVTATAADAVTINSVTVTPASAPSGTTRTLTVTATSSTGSALTFGTPVMTGATFTVVSGQPAGQAQWTFVF